ncbi:MAG: heavy-metal-associated domain-containing protein [Formivibrio sp.]|nr:heavy-metal-associated domain-containing protein [Formivibrio sp.]
METIILKIDGISCMGCVRTLTGVLGALPGVASVEVSKEAGAATINFDPAQTGAAAFKAAVEGAGYDLA